MTRPNVLLICADHWFGDLIGALGHPVILTPTLDHIIGNGIAYTNAYAPTPTCIPARRELMTGTHSRTHGDRVFNETLPMPDLPTMAPDVPRQRVPGLWRRQAPRLPAARPHRLRRRSRARRGAAPIRYDKGRLRALPPGRGLRGPRVRARRLQQRLHGQSLAPAGVPSPDELDGTRDVEVHRAARPEEAWILVHVVQSAAPAPGTAVVLTSTCTATSTSTSRYYGDWSEDPTGWPYALRARPVGRDTYSPGRT